MPARLNVLYAELALKYRSHRVFLEKLSANCGITITEQRFSKILTGHLRPRPEEKRHIAWKLNKKIRELFPEG